MMDENERIPVSSLTFEVTVCPSRNGGWVAAIPGVARNGSTPIDAVCVLLAELQAQAGDWVDLHADMRVLDVGE